jgi:lipopolysaccharide export system protein LptA
MMPRYAVFVATAIACLAIASAAAAQPKPKANEGPPNAMQGFSKNKGQPVHISADKLEVHDKDKTATFSGKVQVNQGDTVMKCNTLTVFYEGGGDTGKPAASAPPVAEVGPGTGQKIKKLEARGNVIVTQNDQVATGQMATFDMRTNVVTMDGNVVLTQGQNVLRGNRLVVDLATGYSRVESSAGSNGRVQGLFVPSGSEGPGGLPGSGKKPAPAR